MLKEIKKFNILITAGPTWVPIDKVRVITNIFRGNLGITIAQEAAKIGFNVTLLIGPGGILLPHSSNRLRIIQFRYFDELFNLTKKLLRNYNYDIVIQSAAIADYAPVSIIKGKIKSGQSGISIRLKPTPKIIDHIKKINPKIFLVKFKLEVGVRKDRLIEIAFNSMKASNADLIVANKYGGNIGRHRLGYIIDKERRVEKGVGKKGIAKKLLYRIIKELNRNQPIHGRPE